MPPKTQSQRDDLLVEKIFALRTDKATGEQMLHVKWKERAHIHSSWVPLSLLESQPANKPRLQRFLKQWEQERAEGEAQEELEETELPYNAEWTVFERIIAERPSQARNKAGVEYLIKWCMLPYANCTWEHPAEIDISPAKIAQFHRVNTPPRGVYRRNRDPREGFKRPPPSGWKKLESSPLYRDGHELRPYQLEGVNWLLFSWYNRRSVLLADEMGLGKTVQSVAVMDHIARQEKIRGPFLVVAPLSTLQHWQREAESWTTLNCVLYHGSAESRMLIQEHEFTYLDIDQEADEPVKDGPEPTKAPRGKFGAAQGKKGAGSRGGGRGGSVAVQSTAAAYVPGLYKFETLITTFEILHQDLDVLRRVKWRYLVVDEAHRMKNKDSALMHDLRSLDVQHCHLLTGTPLQNNTTELWSLLHFLDSKTFASLDEFIADFGELKTAAQVEKLNSLVRPYLLRRQKNDVEKSLAPLEETIIWVEITLFQKKIYRAVLERNREVLVKGATTASVPSLINIQMELRKCCNHPFLIKGVEEGETQDLSRPEYLERLVYASGKYVLLDKLLPKLRADGHKVLIFSQMVKMLDMLEDFMRERGYSFERLDGTIRGDARQMAIDRFSTTDVFVFLLSTRAGGLGINLTAADTCIILDSDWNPQNDIQAMARSHRIGQQKRVKVFRLVTRNTYESQMVERANRKLGLERALNADRGQDGIAAAAAVGSGTAPNAQAKPGPPADRTEIDLMLKQGAYDIFMDDTSAAFDQFNAADIDQILEGATHITHGAEDEGEAQASVFAKAAFVSDTSANADIDMADPEFWTKIMPELERKEDVRQRGPPRPPTKRARSRSPPSAPPSMGSSEPLGSGERDSPSQRPSRAPPLRCGRDTQLLRPISAPRLPVRAPPPPSALPARAAVPQTSELLGMLEARKRRQVTIQREETALSQAERRIQKRAQADEEKALRKRLRAEAMNDARNWPKIERSRCERALLSFGYGRWGRIRVAAQLEHRSVEAISYFCRMWLFAALQPTVPQPPAAAPAALDADPEMVAAAEAAAKAAAAKAEEAAVAEREAINALLAPLRVRVPELSVEELDYMAPLLSDTGFAERLRRNRTRLLGQLVTLRRLADSIGRCLAPTDDFQAPPLPRAPARDLATWWTRRDDSALLVGAYKHGVRAIEDIRNDSSLPFTTAIAHAATAADVDADGDGEAGDGEDVGDDQDDQEEAGGVGGGMVGSQAGSVGGAPDGGGGGGGGGTGGSGAAPAPGAGGEVTSSALERRLKQLLDAVHEREYALEVYNANHHTSSVA